MVDVEGDDFGIVGPLLLEINIGWILRLPFLVVTFCFSNDNFFGEAGGSAFLGEGDVSSFLESSSVSTFSGLVSSFLVSILSSFSADASPVSSFFVSSGLFDFAYSIFDELLRSFGVESTRVLITESNISFEGVSGISCNTGGVITSGTISPFVSLFVSFLSSSLSPGCSLSRYFVGFSNARIAVACFKNSMFGNCFLFPTVCSYGYLNNIDSTRLACNLIILSIVSSLKG